MLDSMLALAARVNWVDVAGIVLFCVFWGFVLHRNAVSDETYDLSDNLKDPYTNKASPAALVYLSMGGVSLWWVVRQAAAGNDPSDFLLSVLGIFIAKGGLDNAINAWGTRRPPTAPEPPKVEEEK